MTTSGSTDFNLNANEIILEAFDLLGIGSEGEPITADMYDRAKRSLNLLIKTWGAQEHLWTMTEGQVTLVAGQASYQLQTLFPAKPMRVLSVRRRIVASQLDTPMTELARSDYFDLPNKSVQSIPVNYYYDPQRATGTLYVWPTASAATAAAQNLQVTYLRRMDDIDGAADDADLPQEWLQALCYNLAVELGIKYGVSGDAMVMVSTRAAQLYAALKGWDNEPASLMLQPDGGRW